MEQVAALLQSKNIKGGAHAATYVKSHQTDSKLGAVTGRRRSAFKITVFITFVAMTANLSILSLKIQSSALLRQQRNTYVSMRSYNAAACGFLFVCSFSLQSTTFVLFFLFLEDFTRYAHGIVSEYLPLELSEELKVKCGYVTDTSRHTAAAR